MRVSFRFTRAAALAALSGALAGCAALTAAGDQVAGTDEAGAPIQRTCPSLNGRFWRAAPQCPDAIAEPYARAVLEAARNHWDPRHAVMSSHRAGISRGRAFTTVVRLGIDNNGQIVESSLEKSSGHDALDLEALDALRAGRSMPPPPRCAPGREVAQIRVWLCVQT